MEAFFAECRQLAARELTCAFSPPRDGWDWLEKGHSRGFKVG